MSHPIVRVASSLDTHSLDSIFRIVNTGSHWDVFVKKDAQIREARTFLQDAFEKLKATPGLYHVDSKEPPSEPPSELRGGGWQKYWQWKYLMSKKNATPIKDKFEKESPFYKFVFSKTPNNYTNDFRAKLWNESGKGWSKTVEGKTNPFLILPTESDVDFFDLKNSDGTKITSFPEDEILTDDEAIALLGLVPTLSQEKWLNIWTNKPSTAGEFQSIKVV